MQSYLPYLQKGYSRWVQSWQPDETAAKHPFFALSLRTGTLVLLYMVADKLLMRMSRLPLDYYQEPFIYWGFLRHVFSSWYVLPFLFVLMAVIFFHRRLFGPWTGFEQGKSLRLFLTLIAGILAWSNATYDYNLYFDQGHYADRLMLLLFVPLIYWRPIFVLPFLTVLLPVIGQFTALVGYSWAAPFLLIRVLVLFVACIAIRGLTKKFPLVDFVFLSGCLFAAHYWLSGWGKLDWNWLRYDQVFLVLPSAYSNGWLKDLDPDTILAIVQALSPFNGFFKIFVLVVEFGAFMFFFNRRLPLFFLLGWISFHLGILLFTGISFWMWSIAEIGLVYLFLRKGGFSSLPIFTRSHAILGLVLIVGGAYWCKPVKLFWYDLPYSYSYRLEATGVDGKIYELPPTFFSPYEYQFIISGPAYLASHPMLVISDVREDATGARQLMAIQTAEEFEEQEKSNGIIKYYAEGATSFDFFVQRYVGNWNKRLSKDTWLIHFRAPGLLWNYLGEESFEHPQKITQLRIFQVTAFFGKDHYAEIRKTLIYETSFR